MPIAHPRFRTPARILDAAELKKVAPEKRCTFLLCLIHSMQVRGRDSVATMYVKRVAMVHKRAKDDLVEQQLQQQERVERLVTQYEGVLGVLARETTDTRTGRQVRALFGSHQEIESAKRVPHGEELDGIELFAPTMGVW